MNIRQALGFVLFVYCTSVISIDVRADVLRFDFTGTITAAFDNDPGSSPDNVFGAEVSAGSLIAGYFIIDTDAAATQSQAGFNGQGTAAGYELSPAGKISLTMDGVVFESDGTYLASVANDYVSFDGAAPFDIFSVGDGLESGRQILREIRFLLMGFKSWGESAFSLTMILQTRLARICFRPTSMLGTSILQKAVSMARTQMAFSDLPLTV